MAGAMQDVPDEAKATYGRRRRREDDMYPAKAGVYVKKPQDDMGETRPKPMPSPPVPVPSELPSQARSKPNILPPPPPEPVTAGGTRPAIRPAPRPPAGPPTYEGGPSSGGRPGDGRTIPGGGPGPTGYGTREAAGGRMLPRRAGKRRMVDTHAAANVLSRRAGPQY